MKKYADSFVEMRHIVIKCIKSLHKNRLIIISHEDIIIFVAKERVYKDPTSGLLIEHEHIDHYFLWAPKDDITYSSYSSSWLYGENYVVGRWK